MFATFRVVSVSDIFCSFSFSLLFSKTTLLLLFGLGKNKKIEHWYSFLYSDYHSLINDIVHFNITTVQFRKEFSYYVLLYQLMHLLQVTLKLLKTPLLKDNPTCFDLSRSSSGILSFTSSLSCFYSTFKMFKIFIKSGSVVMWQHMFCVSVMCSALRREL